MILATLRERFSPSEPLLTEKAAIALSRLIDLKGGSEAEAVEEALTTDLVINELIRKGEQLMMVSADGEQRSVYP